ncbi:MAG TPA: bifunctional 4-hydroxy-2-oxoglutarate aldolase/2-dehydro-3-deoxy-phosphogluconate aldolase [Anaerohalosphaeraceae bacterium]|jgi:2-dehydro-3-deoxyphosphogluconate aldolase/(4S)-4-hydroxy-2-oxoglutarate aldolase|nr:bifunctional 4-hydroxy-2-oxoglutarate aldolase/2-dehydro-3-deoxy-phosphogluconate aldolase [Anaerohalosphaeraceae bacterium]HRT49767.1 bifunctional 4-hydroxy-2-oxoglutarate aldolase/2-dehydro-3-deoxy-phosphogluconate aldolase [Anaerohalosphaeraceae bacterium]HRT85573.1 bifunctional 4-hydroxy-2-oxoglutarate aldolase/2-dehydro-3-deoxy-phosphogluconate aldolase [Anaerohalosphaeraceae bacterium]
MTAESVYELVRRHGIIAIVRAVGPDLIVDIAEAFYAAGVRPLEVTCNTPGFAGMIRTLRNCTAGRMIIGAGTVVTEDLCRQALAAGAEYIVAPDVNPDVIRCCLRRDVAVFPGAQTATEILTAARHGARIVKIFPASSVGPAGIRQLRGPIDNVDFLAVGGVTLDTIAEFINAGCIGIGIGGSVINKDVLARRDWASLTAEVARYVAAVNASRRQG